MAGWRAAAIFTNHCVDMSGSTTVLAALAVPDRVLVVRHLLEQALRLELLARSPARASNRSSPA